MSTHPVQLRVEPPARLQRVHVLIRLVLLVALGTLAWSSLYWLLYLSLPALAALLVTSEGGERYLAEDAPRFSNALGWLAAAYAYLWMLTDALPDREGSAQLDIARCGTPTAGSALSRIVTSIPAIIVLAILTFAAGILWIVQALVVLVRERPSAALADFLALTLRYQFRLAAWHLSLVDRYPSLASAPAPQPLGDAAAAQR